MTIRVPLTNGGFTIIDDEDAAVIGEFKWHRCGVGARYAGRMTSQPGKKRRIYLHRALMDAPDGLEVDHINGDPLDNRRQNLRLVTRAQNAQNIRRPVGRLGIRGVCWDSERAKYSANATINGKSHRIGRYEKLEDAITAVTEYRREHMPFSAEAEFAQVQLAEEAAETAAAS